MFGPDYLVAPITASNVTNATVYLPSTTTTTTTTWTHVFTNKQYKGGQEVNVATPLDEFPLFQLQSK